MLQLSVVAMELFRPVGLAELLLVLRAQMRAFPPRLPEQPIFYPVLNERYAAQIANDWNTTADARAGYVTRWTMDDAYVQRFAPQTVGDRTHRELWVPAEELDEFNAKILGEITVTQAFFGADFEGVRAERGALTGLDARAQLEAIARVSEGDEGQLSEELQANRECIFAHWLYWTRPDAPRTDRERRALRAIERGWRETERVPLPGR